MTLRTARLVLRPPVPDDLPALQAVLGDPGVAEAQYPARFRTPERFAEVHAHALAHWAQHGWGPWVIERDAEVIGRAGLQHATLDGTPCVEVLWFLRPAAQGHGYATEAAAAAIADRPELPELFAWTLPANTGSQAVMRRLGFAPAGETVRAGLPHVVFRRVRT